MYFFSVFVFLVDEGRVDPNTTNTAHHWASRGLGDLGRMAFYFKGAGEHW